MAHIPHAQIRNAVRKLWLWSAARREALKRAKVVGFKLYLCDGCGRGTPKPDVDHIEPVGPTPGSRMSRGETWDDFMRRMFVGADGLQVLCGECHRQKTRGAAS